MSSHSLHSAQVTSLQQIPQFSNVIECLGGAETRLKARLVPQPGHGELLLALRVVGLCGTDLFKLHAGQAARGTVLGHELVGEVLALGEGVTDFSVGERVAVPHHVPCGHCRLCLRGSETLCNTFRENLLFPGGFAEHLIVKERAVKHCTYKLPAHVSDAAAAFIEPAACVMRGIQRSQLAAGDTAAILGAGSMGLLHLLLLRAYLPEVQTLVVDPVLARQTQALELGATYASSPGDDAKTKAETLTDELGIDVVFDTVGGSLSLAAGLELGRQGGTVVLFAHAGDGEQATLDLNDLFKFERRVLGTYSGSVREQQTVFELLISGSFDPTPLISHQLPLEEFTRGVELARARKALKVLFTPTGGG